MLRKSLFKKVHGNDAVTDMVGTLLLLMIAIALFSIVYYAVFSFEPIDHPPSVNIISYVDDKNVTFEHWGGVSLHLDDTRVLFNIGGVKFENLTSHPDFNGDKNADILLHHQTTGQLYIWLMDGTTKIGQGSIGTVNSSEWAIISHDDFNGDGNADILLHHQTTGQLYIWLMDGANKIGQGSIGIVNRDWVLK